MFSDNNRISKRQVFRLLTYDMLGLGTLLVPTALGQRVAGDGIFCIGIGMVLAFLFLGMLRALTMRMNQDYLSHLKDETGGFFSRLFLLGYLIYFALFAGYVAYIFVSLVMNNLLKEESPLLILALLLLLVFYGIWEGIEGRARVYEILFWVVIIPLFFMLFSACNEIQTDYWTPVFVSDISDVAAGSYCAFWPFSLVFLVLFAGEHMGKKEQGILAGRSAILFAGIVYGILYLVLLGIFGASALGNMEYPAVTLMSTVKTFGGFLKRTDAFMFAIWFFTLYALLSSMVYYGATVLQEIFRRRNRNRGEKKRERLAVLVLLVITFCLAWKFYVSEAARGDFEWFLFYLGTPFIVLVPLLLLILSGAKGNRAGVKYKKAGVMAVLLLFAGVLCGCNTAELEERNYPIEIGVKDTDSFVLEWLDAKQGGNRVIDYNHLKVMIIGTEFFADEEKMRGFLDLLEDETDVPRNTYVVVADDPEQMMQLKGDNQESIGNYLEQLFENVSFVKKKMYPTLGMLYQEKENQLETLFVPYLKESSGKPVVEEFVVWKRGTMQDVVSSDVAMLSFFTQNGMESYTLVLEGTAIQLSATKNKVNFVDWGGKEVEVQVICQGKVLYGIEENPQQLQVKLESYMNEIAKGALAQGIDVTNSYRKLGGDKRDWFFQYREQSADYEDDVHIVYKTTISWVNE